MKVKDVMSESVTCCSPDARLPEVARAMIECDCGEIPVVDDKERMRPIGVVTDRDIVVRAVAAEQDTRELKASAAGSSTRCRSLPCPYSGSVGPGDALGGTPRDLMEVCRVCAGRTVRRRDLLCTSRSYGAAAVAHGLLCADREGATSRSSVKEVVP